MRYRKDGIEYVTGTDAVFEFCAFSTDSFRRYRKQGMPFIKLDSDSKRKYKKTESERYAYPLKKCQRWFAGEEFKHE